MQITVLLPEGDNIQLCVMPSNTSQDVMELLRQHGKVQGPPGEWSLYYGNQELVDHLTLEEQNIRHGSVLHLRRKRKKGKQCDKDQKKSHQVSEEDQQCTRSPDQQQQDQQTSHQQQQDQQQQQNQQGGHQLQQHTLVSVRNDLIDILALG